MSEEIETELRCLRLVAAGFWIAEDFPRLVVCAKSYCLLNKHDEIAKHWDLATVIYLK